MPRAPIEPRLLTGQQAAEYLNTSVATLTQLVEDGLMPPPKMVHKKKRLWDRAQIDEHIEMLPIADEYQPSKSWSHLE